MLLVFPFYQDTLEIQNVMMGSSHTLLYYGRRFQFCYLGAVCPIHIHILAQVMALES